MEYTKSTLLQITQNGMGKGDKELGLLLVNSYLKLIVQENTLPKFIAFYNEGVRLLCNGSLALESLKTMQEKGVKLIACKTCLNHFNLIDEQKVGVAGTMIDIIELQNVVDKVITL